MTTQGPVLSTKTRPTGSQVMQEHFPEHRALWQLLADKRNGFSSGFLLTALQINGRVVMLQEFDGPHAGSWDVYVPASDSGRIDDTVAAVANAVKEKRGGLAGAGSSAQPTWPNALAGAESAAEHVRNAMQVLDGMVDVKLLEVYEDLMAIRRRLEKALALLEPRAAGGAADATGTP